LATTLLDGSFELPRMLRDHPRAREPQLHRFR
jgi:hypothetical protein